MSRPEFADNLRVTHLEALQALRDEHAIDHPLAVATGYVNLEGLHLLVTTFEEDRPARLLLGAEPDPLLGADLPLDRLEIARAALSAERDLSRFPPSRNAARLAVIEGWIGRGDVEIRRYVDRFLHGKAYLVGSVEEPRAALVTSANLTGAGLARNLELGAARWEPSPAREPLRWFDGLWADAEEYGEELRALLFPQVELVDPQTAYLRALLELYGDEVEEEVQHAPSPGGLELAPFQRDGYERARAILERHGGVVYADGVGTGKTFVGLKFIEEYALTHGQHALVIAPAQLAKEWEQHLDRFRLPGQVLTLAELATDEQLAPGDPRSRRRLHNDRDMYRLIVIDEGHAFRTPGTTYARALERLMGGTDKRLVLLTATPVNNGLWDLYHLVMTFARHDRALTSAGIPSIREVFVRAGANERDPELLDPDVLFPVADAVSVRRDRDFIVRRYPDAVFTDGTPVRFPTPRLRTVRYDLDAAAPELVRRVASAINGLRMARYRPSAYLHVAEEAADERTLAALIQSSVLKRFESCWASCLATVERMLAGHQAFLAAWDEGFVPSGRLLREAASDLTDEAGLAGWVLDQVEADVETRPAIDFDERYREHVDDDRRALVRLRDDLAALTDEPDPKLAGLVEVLEELASEKVVVFSSYGDTIDYLDRHLPALVGGRAREVVIGSQTDPDERTRRLARLAPRSVVADDYVPPDGEVDLLLATDVLSEGQNLQQAGAVVSYDMPWNPQRVVQRNGRVIRLKSPHDEVELVTMLPEEGALNRLLGLESTIRRKIRAASVYGMESAVLDDVEVELRTYADRLAGGDAGLLTEADQEEAGFAGESLRAELRRAFEEGEAQRIRALPWGIGAVFRQGPGVPSIGPPGTFFAFRTRQGQRYWRYVEREPRVVDPARGPERQLIDLEGRILRRINPGSAAGEEPPADLDLEGDWRIAVEDVVRTHNELADPRNAELRLGPVQRKVLALLRDPSVALPVGAEEAEEALSVERSRVVRRELQAVLDRLDKAEIGRDAAAAEAVRVVNEFGLHPVAPPPPLEVIDDDEVGVVVWMSVSSGSGDPANVSG